jgi:hypothetical protein
MWDPGGSLLIERLYTTSVYKRRIAMNYTDYINSKDVREYLASIVWKPNSLEASWFIFHSKNHTLKEKISAWEDLISTMPDMDISENHPSLHVFLQTYIEKVRRLCEAFEKNDGGIYSYSLYIDGEGWIRDHELYSSYERVLEATEEDDDLGGIVRFSVQKRWPDIPSNTWYCYLSPTREIISIDNSSCIMPDEDYEILYEIFQGVWFDIPFPFHKGDILNEVNGKYGIPAFYEQTFVFTKCITEDENLKKSETLGNEDMMAFGFFSNGDGTLYESSVPCFLDCEYYVPDPLTDDELLIKKSNLLKGEK